MRLISYDCEVFAYDWLVTLKDKETGVYTCIWNDNEALKMALSDDCIYVGFNSKHYDQYIIKAIAAGFAPEEIKRSTISLLPEGKAGSVRFSMVSTSVSVMWIFETIRNRGYLLKLLKGTSVCRLKNPAYRLTLTVL